MASAARGVYLLCLERTVAISEEYVYISVRFFAAGNVEISVSIEVRQVSIGSIPDGTERSGSLKGAVAISQQDVERTVACDDEIEPAVIIEVTRTHKQCGVTEVSGDWRLESSVPIP